MKSFFVVVPSGFWRSLGDINEGIPLRDPFHTVSPVNWKVTNWELSAKQCLWPGDPEHSGS